MNTCLMPSRSTTHPCRQNHSTPGCAFSIGNRATLPSAWFSIAPATARSGPKFPRPRDRAHRRQLREFRSGRRDAEGSLELVAMFVNEACSKWSEGTTVRADEIGAYWNELRDAKRYAIGLARAT